MAKHNEDERNPGPITTTNHGTTDQPTTDLPYNPDDVGDGEPVDPRGDQANYPDEDEGKRD